MATGWADVDDAYKRYFDGEGHMLTGWQQIGDRTFYFRPSGAMQTGKATIDGVEYEFTASGTLKS
jgi:glucan-binding YG repeat protein